MKLSCDCTRQQRSALAFFFVLGTILFLGRPLNSQTLFQNSGATARTVGLGGPHLLGPVDAANALWNPATLASLREAGFLLTSNQPFEFSLVGSAGYWPDLGSFGLSIARLPIANSQLERASAAWAYSIDDMFSFGISLHGNRLQQDEFFTASLGAIWHPRGSRLPLSRDPYHASFFNVPLTPFPLAFSLQASDLPLGTQRLSNYYVAGAAARLREDGPALLASLEWQSQKSWTRLGVASPIMRGVALYGGLVDFKPKNAALGFAFLGGSYSLDVAYSFAEKKAYSSVAFRLGLKAEERARRHLSQGMALAKAANFREALKEFERHSKYDVESPTEQQIRDLLALRVREEDEKISRLMSEAADQERQLKYFEAALTYHAVLQLNRKHEMANYRLAGLQPRLESHIQRKYNEGQRFFDKGNYAQSRQIFENVLLLRKNHAGAREYIVRLNDVQQKAAEQAYFRGVGYFNQQNFIKAQEFFQQALTISPNYKAAQGFLDSSRVALQRQKEEIDRLLAEANRLVQKQQIYEAYRIYRQALEIDPENETARQQGRVLQSRIDAFVNEKLQAANRAFERGEYSQAFELCQQIFTVAPRHEEAKALQQRIDQINTKRSDEFVRRGMDYFEAREWNRAVAEFDKALSHNPKNQMALQKRQEALSQSNIQQLLDQAQVYFNQNQFLQAVEFYKTILARDPNNPVARIRLEECQRQLAVQVERYFERGLRLFALDDYEAAIREWDKVLNIDPAHKQSLEYKQRAQQQLETLRKLRE